MNHLGLTQASDFYFNYLLHIYNQSDKITKEELRKSCDSDISKAVEALVEILNGKPN